jgi:hypothetical protein
MENVNKDQSNQNPEESKPADKVGTNSQDKTIIYDEKMNVDN